MSRKLSTTTEVLDFSFCSLKDGQCIIEAMPHERIEEGEEEGQESVLKLQKSYSRSLLLNNNQLTEIKDLPMTLKTILFTPNLLAWLDLSFNHILELAPIFKPFTCLKILYLHGNQISSMDTISYLKVLNKSLVKLTLHGNPIKDVKGYRMILINMMSNVKEIDFSLVSESERKVAAFLMGPRKRSGKKRKPKD